MGLRHTHNNMVATQATGLARGKNKGHIVTRRELPARVANRKGRLGKQTKFVREIVREIMGFAPYEKRCMELLKVGKEKRALKVCKAKLGSHKRAKAKREDMQESMRQ